MAPTKNTSTTSNRSVAKDAIATLLPMARKGITRNKSSVQDQNMDVIQTRAKRKADNHSPIKNEKIKRSALGNLTNNAMTTASATTFEEENKRKQQTATKKVHGNNHVLKDSQNIVTENKGKILTRASSKTAKSSLNANKKKPAVAIVKPNIKDGNAQSISVSLLPPPAPVVTNNAVSLLALKAPPKSTRRISNEFNQTEDSLYMSALEDISSCESMRLSENFEAAKRRSILLQQQQQLKEPSKTDKDYVQTPDDGLNDQAVIENDDKHYKDPLAILEKTVPNDVDDFDKANWNDPFQVSNYAMDIFNYLKTREPEFKIDDYMLRQVYLSKWMRTLLVDWMVEVQETFELNHETLYLAVKIVDLYLCKVIIQKDRLQLLGAAALFIACKYDERTPPLIEDFLYICDGAYKHDELVKMEMLVLRTIDYDLGIPLSYRFLRRYARCAKVTMPTLTLARYVLELSLMDYETITLSDSRLACAALFIALRLHGNERKGWTATLEFYTGYKLAEFADIIPILNAGLHRKPNATIKNIRNKYSHKIFHEVAKVKLMSTEELFKLDLDESVSKRNFDGKSESKKGSKVVP